MVIKHYFLSELDRDVYEKAVLQHTNIDAETVQQMDDQELTNAYQAHTGKGQL